MDVGRISAVLGVTLDFWALNALSSWRAHDLSSMCIRLECMRPFHYTATKNMCRCRVIERMLLVHRKGIRRIQIYSMLQTHPKLFRNKMSSCELHWTHPRHRTHSVFILILRLNSYILVELSCLENMGFFYRTHSVHTNGLIHPIAPDFASTRPISHVQRLKNWRCSSPDISTKEKRDNQYATPNDSITESKLQQLALCYLFCVCVCGLKIANN